MKAARRALQLKPGIAEYRDELISALVEDGLTPSGELRSEELREARELLLRSLKENPANGEAHYRLGRVLLTLGDRSGAVIHLRSAQRAFPKRTEIADILAKAQNRSLGGK